MNGTRFAVALSGFPVQRGFTAPVPVSCPALAGALTGIASLIPVVGTKLVYVPLAAATSAPAVLKTISPCWCAPPAVRRRYGSGHPAAAVLQR